MPSSAGAPSAVCGACRLHTEVAMSATVRRVEYYYLVVEDRPGEAYQLLAHLASAQVNLLAFNALPLGIDKTQLMIFPEDPARLRRDTSPSAPPLSGPQHAFLIQGDDELGALVDLHRRLSEANINVACATGVTDGRGGFGYVLYVRQEDFERAARVLGV
jgi:hypothetical protein